MSLNKWLDLARLMGPQGLHFMLPLLHGLCEENRSPLESISAAQALWSVFCLHCHPTLLQPSSWENLNGIQTPRYLIFKTPLWLCGKATSLFLYRRGKGVRTEREFTPSSSQLCSCKLFMIWSSKQHPELGIQAPHSVPEDCSVPNGAIHNCHVC